MSAPLPVLVGLDGLTLLSRERELLRRFRPSGVILFKRNVDSPAQLSALCGEVETLLAAESAVPLIAADQEGGAVSVLGQALGCPPSARALGLAGEPELTRRVHRETARRARRAGVNLLLAPVADVNRPRNPVVGIRSFGEETELVAAHAAAAVRGLREGGVYACVKHWPGHGSPRGDSHHQEAALELDFDSWQKIDLPPFETAVGAGAEALMVGHLAYSQLDPNGTVAPLSPLILREARRRLSFSGVLMSDALEMKGFGQADPVRALQAGLDLLLYSRPLGEIEDAVHSLQEALRAGGKRSDLSWGSLSPPPVAEDGGAYAEARRRGFCTQGRLRWEARSWVLWDGVSRDRLYPFPDFGPREQSATKPSPHATGRASEISLEVSLARALGVPARRVFSWDPHAPTSNDDPAVQEAWPRAGEGLVVSSLRPLPPDLQKELTESLASRALRPGWILFLGLGPDSPAKIDVPWGQVPGLCEEDLGLLGTLLTGRR